MSILLLIGDSCMSEDDKTDTSDPTQVTVSKTLWSETLIELLVVSLQKNQSDEKVIELLKELRQKKFKTNYIIDKTKRALGEKEANRVKLLLGKL
jgi:histidyl-tRNA synthetase